MVKPGNASRAAQVIAKLGSSGSTSIGPHLHFHVADANSLLGAEGLPFVFSHFTVLGEFASIAGAAGRRSVDPPASSASCRRRNTRPAPNAVISFP